MKRTKGEEQTLFSFSFFRFPGIKAVVKMHPSPVPRLPIVDHNDVPRFSFGGVFATDIINVVSLWVTGKWKMAATGVLGKKRTPNGSNNNPSIFDGDGLLQLLVSQSLASLRIDRRGKQVDHGNREGLVCRNACCSIRQNEQRWRRFAKQQHEHEESNAKSA